MPQTAVSNYSPTVLGAFHFLCLFMEFNLSLGSVWNKTTVKIDNCEKKSQDLEIRL